MKSIALIVVNFNAGSHLRRCLESAAADLGARDWSGIVIDNASTDGSARTIEEMPRISVVVNTANRGFGAAVNQAVSMTDARLLWLVNPDCVVQPGTFDRLDAALAVHADCAIAAPQLLNADGSVQASVRRAPTLWTGVFGRHSLLTRLFPGSAMARRELPAADLAAAAEDRVVVDWVMGAAMLIRREAFDAVEGFDEGYFLYWEDADVCRRLGERGWTTRYVPSARVTHAGGVSAGTSRAFATRAFHRSAYLYYSTHVVRSPLHPLRWVAKAALAARAWWRA